MIITKDFVFLAMPKTASSWVIEILSRNFDTIQHPANYHKHDGFIDIPVAYQHLPTFGVLREEREWCLSTYNYFIKWVLMGTPIPEPEVGHYYEAIERNGIHLEALYEYELQRMFGHGTAILRLDHLRDDLRDFLMPHMSGSKADKLDNDINTLQAVNIGVYQENQVARFFHT